VTPRYMFSASETDRVFACPASAVLPHVFEESPHARLGTILHAYLEAVARDGRDRALDAVPDEHRDAAAALTLDGLPLDSAGWVAELAVAWDWTTDTARELGRGVGRAYETVLHTEIPGTADVVGLASDAVVVLDYKTGYGSLPPAGASGQLRTLALALCRLYGRDRAIVGYLRPGRDGVPAWCDRAELDALDIDGHGIAVKRHVADLFEAAEHGDGPDGDSPGRFVPTVLGRHCRYCPALRVCPGQVGLLRGALSGDAVDSLVALRGGPIFVPDAAAAFERIGQIRKALTLVEEAIFAVARQTPIPLSDGRVLGEVVTTRESVEGPVARAVLHELHGAETADRACDYTASKASITRALRPIAQATGETLASLERHALDVLRHRGGVAVKHTTAIKVHTPPRAR